MEQETKTNKRISPLLIAAIAAVVIMAGIVLALKPWQSGGVENLENIDLTSMNATMVYAYVNDMMNNRPEDYLGKTIKAKGEAYQSNENKHFIIISDATACCAQGIEFLYEGEYPRDGVQITLEGRLEKYIEGSVTYYYISAVTLTIH